MGLIAGVSDLVYLKPGGRPYLLELKIETGIQSQTQKEWQHKVEQAGYEYRIIRSLAEAVICFSAKLP